MFLTWNPWHGCRKYSEGCAHCYMYYLDAQRDRDGSEIYRTKTNFNLPVKKTRQGAYKIPSGTMLHVCMTSDFFLQEARIAYSPAAGRAAKRVRKPPCTPPG